METEIIYGKQTDDEQWQEAELWTWAAEWNDYVQNTGLYVLLNMVLFHVLSRMSVVDEVTMAVSYFFYQLNRNTRPHHREWWLLYYIIYIERQED